MVKKKLIRLFLSGDHAGFELKQKLKSYLARKGFIISDFGPLKLNKQDDYTDFVIPMAQELSKTRNTLGICIAGSGQGEAIAANKVKGIRAALYYGKDLNIIKLARQHNNANVLSIGARFVKEAEAKKAIDLFLKTKFQAGRHKRRLNKISKLEK